MAPERRLLQLDVNQSRYIKRKPLAAPDRDRLLQQTEDPNLRQLWFTTEAYKAAALKAMLKEINWAANALGLAEKLPIESTNLTGAIIGTPYQADRGRFAVLFTENYAYTGGQKLTSITRNRHPEEEGEEQHYIALLRTRYTMPTSRMNTQRAYMLATQWLAAASVDLKRLEADYPSEISPLWVSDSGAQFVPLYTVEWVKPIEGTRRRDVAVQVELLEPERSLECIAIERPEYIMRPPLSIPDRAELLRKN